MKKVLPVFLVFLGLAFWFRQGIVEAATANHVVISEIHIGGVGTGNADMEFVELYNPTDIEIDLTDWRLKVGINSNLVANMSGSIKSHSYFLIANPAYITISKTPDMMYSASSSAITASSFLTLLRKDGSNLVVEDLVGMGTAAQFEGTATSAPDAGKSIERKSDENGMTEGEGNGWDTDNNVADFVVRDVPEPQNSNSDIEPAISPTSVPPTPTVEPSPTENPPSPTNEPSPTDIPITPTSEPTPTEVIPSPTTEPMPTETQPSPTIVPIPSVTPILTPPPTQDIVTPLLTCSIRYKSKVFWGVTIWFPTLTCYRTVVN